MHRRTCLSVEDNRLPVTTLGVPIAAERRTASARTIDRLL